MSLPPRITETATPSGGGGFGGSPLTPRSAKRIATFGAILLALFGVLVVRLWFLQVVGARGLQEQAVGNSVRTINIPAPRGLILDRNGVELAKSRLAWDVVALPQDLGVGQDSSGKIEFDEVGLRTLGKIARALDDDPLRLRRLLAYGQKRTPYKSVVLKADLSEDDPLFLALNERIREFPGIRLERNFRREYPNGARLSHVLGYVGQIQEDDAETYRQRGYRNDAIVGQMGLERKYEDFLKGVDGERRVEVDASGQPTARGVISERPPKAGRTLKTTIDINVQSVLEDALRQEVEFKGERDAGGGGVVLDARTGEVIALASYPGLDPDAFSRNRRATIAKIVRNPRKPFRNRALSAYPPGSTFKPVTAIAALNAGYITPETFLRSPPVVKLFGTEFNNFRKLRQPDMQVDRALTVSSDTWFYQAGATIFKRASRRDQINGDNKLRRWAQELGLGEPTNVDLVPGEEASVLPDRLWKTKNISKKLEPTTWNQWRAGDTVNMSVGQGFLTESPIQMARAYAAMVNGGRILTPTIGWQVVDALTPDSVIFDQSKGRPERNVVFNPGTLEPIQKGLLGVTSNGEGTAIRVFGRFPGLVAGKTGTAENRPGHKDHAWFVGYGPAEAPEYVVAVVVENAGLGASAAAPAACKAIVTALQRDPKQCGSGAPDITSAGGD